MLIKNLILYLSIFLFSSLKSIDLTPPSVNFAGELGSVAVQHVPGLLHEVSAILLKNGAAWMPTLIIGGIATYAGLRILAYLKMSLNNMIESCKNVYKAPGRVKDIKDNLFELDEKLSAHIEGFDKWKSIVTNYLDSISEGIEVKLSNIRAFIRGDTQETVNNARDIVCETVNNQYKQTQNDIQNNTEQLQQLTQKVEEQYPSIQKQLRDIHTTLVDLQLRLEGLPDHIDETKQVGEHLIDKVDHISEKVDQQSVNHVSGQTQAIMVRNGGNGSLSGNGIFTQLIRPELDKIYQEQRELRAQLEAKVCEEGKLQTTHVNIEMIEKALQRQLPYMLQEVSTYMVQEQAKIMYELAFYRLLFNKIMPNNVEQDKACCDVLQLQNKACCDVLQLQSKDFRKKELIFGPGKAFNNKWNL